MSQSEASVGGWPAEWWFDRTRLDPAGTTVLDFDYTEEAEFIEISYDSAVRRLADVVDENLQLREKIEVSRTGDVRHELPGGARLLERAALSCGCLQNLWLPASLAFRRTPCLNPKLETWPSSAIAALDPSGGLRQALSHVSPGNLRRLSLVDQQLGYIFASELFKCVADTVCFPRELCLAGNRIEDRAMRTFVSMVDVAPPDTLRHVDLSRNCLTKRGAWDALGSMASLAGRYKLCDREHLFLDVTFNCICDPRRFLQDAQSAHDGVHAPCGECGAEWCAKPPGEGVPLHLNVGPSWRKSTFLECQPYGKRWQCFMHGPCQELAQNVEEFGQGDGRCEWQCPLDGEKVNPHAARQRLPNVTYVSALSSHLLGHTHRKKAGHWLECGNTEQLVMIRPASGTDVYYYFNPFTGAQGRSPDCALREPDDCDFLRPNWWYADGEELDANPSAQGISASSCNRAANALVTAYKLKKFRSQERRVELRAEEHIELRLTDNSGAPRRVCHGGCTFEWRAWLKSRDFARGLPEVRSFALEEHVSAVDCKGEKEVYFAIEFEGQPTRMLVKPGCRPLFEDAAGFLVSMDSWPETPFVEGRTIFATRARHVYDAFWGSRERRLKRLHLCSGSRHYRAFCKDVDAYLCETLGLTKDELWDSEAECSKVHTLIGHRAYLDREKHVWRLDSGLEVPFCTWLQERLAADHDEMSMLRSLAQLVHQIRKHYRGEDIQQLERYVTYGEPSAQTLAAQKKLKELVDEFKAKMSRCPCYLISNGFTGLRDLENLETTVTHKIARSVNKLGHYIVSWEVGDLRFTKASIPSYFSGGRHYGKSLDSTISALKAHPGSMQLSLHGIFFRERLYILNNRRLYCLKEALPPGEKVLVNVFPFGFGPCSADRNTFIDRFMCKMWDLDPHGDHSCIKLSDQASLAELSAANSPTLAAAPVQSPSDSTERSTNVPCASGGSTNLWSMLSAPGGSRDRPERMPSSSDRSAECFRTVLGALAGCMERLGNVLGILGRSAERPRIVPEAPNEEDITCEGRQEVRGIAMMCYDAIERKPDGYLFELGYLRVQAGDSLWMLSGPRAGHAYNRFPNYIYVVGHTGMGWFPEELFERQ